MTGSTTTAGARAGSPARGDPAADIEMANLGGGGGGREDSVEKGPPACGGGDGASIAGAPAVVAASTGGYGGGKVPREVVEATNWEKTMSFAEALKMYKWGVIWSVIWSASLIMEGYDTALLGNFYAYPQFTQKFGVYDEATDSWQISPQWQMGLHSSQQVGQMVGLYIAATAIDRWGFKPTMRVALFSMICLIFMPLFSPNLIVLVCAEFLQGIPWGAFQTMAAAYASEVTPVALRPYTTTYINLCWLFGQLESAIVLRCLLSMNSEWGFRIPFALQWCWPVPLFIVTAFAPESPWHLVRKGRLDEARAVLRRIRNPKVPARCSVDETLAMMEYTTRIERESQEGGASWSQLFRGHDRRRTEIACCAWATQAMCGSAFMGFGTYFFQRAGMKIQDSFNLNLAQYIIGIMGTVASWWIMSYVGRRKIFVVGLASMVPVLVAIGVLGYFTHVQGISWAVGGLIVTYTLVYNISLGPVTFALVSEMPSTRLKSKTIAVARNLYNLGNVFNTLVVPNMLNPKAWNWGAKTGLFWAGITFLCLIWAFFRLPEPKGRTFAEMEMLFSYGVPAAKFRRTRLTEFDEPADKDGSDRNSGGGAAAGREPEHDAIDLVAPPAAQKRHTQTTVTSRTAPASDSTAVASNATPGGAAVS